jgi:hypothetical protein
MAVLAEAGGRWANSITTSHPKTVHKSILARREVILKGEV